MIKYFLEDQELSFCQPKDGDAGFDIRAAGYKIIRAGETRLISTGLYLAIDARFVGFIKDRSSMAVRGIRTSGGVIDASYRGEVKLVVTNYSPEDYEIKKGDKVAQIVFLPFYPGTNRGELVEVSDIHDLGETERSQDGFGSTGQ